MSHTSLKGRYRDSFVGLELGLAIKLRLFQDRFSEAGSGEGLCKVGRWYPPFPGLQVGCGHRAEIFELLTEASQMFFQSMCSWFLLVSQSWSIFISQICKFDFYFSIPCSQIGFSEICLVSLHLEFICILHKPERDKFRVFFQLVRIYMYTDTQNKSLMWLHSKSFLYNVEELP